MKKLTKEEFIKKAIAVHGDVYDYSEVVYVRWDEKVKILCSKHGMFAQTPNSHLSGKACLECYWQRSPILFKKKTTEQFILDSNIIHKNRYDYSKTTYTTAHGKVEIICNIHGSFMKSATHHLNGQGCPLCKGSNIKLQIVGRKRKKMNVFR